MSDATSPIDRAIAVRVAEFETAVWPQGRYLELDPRHRRITRARLDRKQLDLEVGWLRSPSYR